MYSTPGNAFAPKELYSVRVKNTYHFASSLIENKGSGTFDMKSLPLKAQFSSVYTIMIDDFDQDGHQDILLAGNFYAVGPKQGRYDAGYGLLLKGDGKGNFVPVETDKSRFVVKGETRVLKTLYTAKRNKLIIAAKNNDRL